MVDKVFTCRICKSNLWNSVIDLGDQFFTGVFPLSISQNIPKGELHLVSCGHCFLLQLKDSFDQDLMYGDNYGYRSGLNQTMVNHLKGKVQQLSELLSIKQTDTILDIGSNDGTTLNAFALHSSNLVGFDPTARKFRRYYSNLIKVHETFFSADEYLTQHKKAKIITSLAMFYDLEDPIEFAKQIKRCLSDDGIWHFEQSYALLMIENLTFDTICHEHIEYYMIKDIITIMDEADLKIIDIELNDINGGSFAVSATHKNSNKFATTKNSMKLIEKEKIKLENYDKLFDNFSKRINNFRKDFVKLIQDIIKTGEEVWCLGASTKGNVLLQFCGLDTRFISGIAEINEDKWNRHTPGTLIPIHNESVWRKKNPKFTIVLPWHFKESIESKNQAYISNGGTLIFPLPEITLISEINS
jgi:hypothetical protein